MKIFLIGYMGCGKSSLGKPLARLMNHKFIDLDLYIEQECMMKISDIFTQYGEPYFRKIEAQLLLELCENEENCVISTGGGTPCFGDNMEIMNYYGTTVYINLDRGIICSRLQCSKRKRPLIATLDADQIKEFINTSMDNREPYYKKADIEITGTNIKPNDIYQFITSNDKKIL